MSCDLERVYGDLAGRLPEDLPEGPDYQPFALDETVLPAAPGEMETDRVCIRRGHLQRLPGCRGDQLDVIAARPTFRHLGLLALAVLFHEHCDRTTIHLTDPESSVKHVVIEYVHYSKPNVSGFRVRPWVLGYVPEEIGHTFCTDEVGFGAPVLRLTNLADCQHDETEWRDRDTLRGIGGIFATAEVAEFLLNAGRSASLGHFTIPANGTLFTAEVILWVPERWQMLRRSLAEIQNKYGTQH